MTTHGSAAIRTWPSAACARMEPGLPHVVSVSLGANDAPARREWFRQQVLGVLEIAGETGA